MHLKAIGEHLAALRRPNEGAVILSFGAHAPDFECSKGSVSITVEKGGETATASAAGTGLDNALALARAKVERQIEARAKKAEATHA